MDPDVHKHARAVAPEGRSRRKVTARSRQDKSFLSCCLSSKKWVTTVNLLLRHKPQWYRNIMCNKKNRTDLNGVLFTVCIT